MIDTANPLGLDESLADIDALERKAQEFEAQAEAAERKAQALRQIIAGVRLLNGDAGAILMQRSFGAHRTQFEMSPPDEKGPRGPKAVLAVMREQPHRVWKVVELKREMLRRGWAQTPKAVEASVKRLRETGELAPAGYGHYTLSPDPIDAGEQEVIAC